MFKKLSVRLLTSNLLGAARDAGWVVAMVLICVTTFAISAMFVNCGSRQRGSSLRNSSPKTQIARRSDSADRITRV